MSILKRIFSSCTNWFYPRVKSLDVRIDNESGYPLVVKYDRILDRWVLFRGPIEPKPLTIFQPEEESE